MYAYGNEIEPIPECIGEKIRDIPVSIGKLKDLTTLEVGGNQIAELPDSIGQFKQLAKMDLRDNPIAVLPASLRNLKNLNKPRLLKGNPLSELSAELTQNIRWVY